MKKSTGGRVKGVRSVLQLAWMIRCLLLLLVFVVAVFCVSFVYVFIFVFVFCFCFCFLFFILLPVFVLFCCARSCLSVCRLQVDLPSYTRAVLVGVLVLCSRSCRGSDVVLLCSCCTRACVLLALAVLVIFSRSCCPHARSVLMLCSVLCCAHAVLALVLCPCCVLRLCCARARSVRCDL